MRTLRRLLTVSLFVSALILSTFAGEITTGVAPPQPAPTPASVEGDISTPVNGVIHTTNSDEATAGDAVVAEAALSLLQGVLSLL